MAGNFRSVSFGKMLQPKMDCRHIVKSAVMFMPEADSIIPFKQPIYLSRSEVCNISTFPQDYHFLNQSPHYICGMSVPPVMMAHVASRIWKYWLSKL